MPVLVPALRQRATTHFRRAMADVDVLLLPTTPCAAPAIPAGALANGINDIGLTSLVMRFVLQVSGSSLQCHCHCHSPINLPSSCARCRLPQRRFTDPTTRTSLSPRPTRVRACMHARHAQSNMLGFPAASVPVGTDAQGLPLGFQIVGKPWTEGTVLR